MSETTPKLTKSEKAALSEIKSRVAAVFDIRRYILFGSKARGDAHPDSDIDLLIITARKLSHRERHVVSDIIFEVNLAYDTLFSFVAIDDNEWNSSIHSLYPVHENIEREGVEV